MHARKVGDQTLSFIVSGKLWRNSLIMQDKETGSLWSHIMGDCLDGEYVGTQLEMIPVVQTTWSEWVQDHPETRVLKKSEEIKSSQYERYFNDPDRAGLFPAVWLEDKLPGKSLIHGVLVGAYSLAVPDTVLVAGKPVQVELGNVPLLITRGSDGGVRAERTDTGEEVQVRTAFWFAWSTYFPRTEIVE